jgi:UDP-GlcNAc:undecaprenyl-phosphate GlcNAc-1-phosphate transferase
MKALVFFLTLLFASGATPYLVRLAGRLSITCSKGEGKIRAVPLLGGLSIYISFTAATALVFLFSRGEMLGEYDYHYLGIVLGGSVIAALGAYADTRRVSLPLKLGVESLAALFLLLCGYHVHIITNPFGGVIRLGWWGYPIAILWLVAMTNALAAIDVVDGLAAGVAGIAAAVLFFASLNGPPFVPVISLAAAGACLGFLRYNFYPARIFPGSSGNLFLGFVLAAIALQGDFKVTAGISFLLPLLALAFPVIRKLFISSRRQPGRKTSAAAGEFLPRRLLRLGYSPRQTVLILYLIQTNLGIAALVMNYASRGLALAVFLLLGMMVYLLIRMVEDYHLYLRKMNEAAEEELKSQAPNPE